MFYYYLRIFNWLCSLFGMRKPFLSHSGKTIFVSLWNKIWLAIIAASVLIFYLYTMIVNRYDLNISLEEMSDINNLVINVLMILIDLINSDKVCVTLYGMYNNMFAGLGFDDKNLKTISFKLYFWFSLFFVMFLITFSLEIIYDSYSYLVILRIPTFFSYLHLILHLYLTLAFLTVINVEISEMLSFEDSNPISKVQNLFPRPSFKDTVKNIFDPVSNFVEAVRQKQNFDLKFSCKVYDNLSTCIRYLEEYHGFQVLLLIWSMFSNSVIGITLIVCKQGNYPWLVIVRSLMLFFWCFIGCCIDDHIRKEVEKISSSIMKHLIDFRCDQPTTTILQNFKQLVSTNRLHFTAYNLFDLNYSMMLSAILNVITYSIILIQLFLSG